MQSEVPVKGSGIGEHDGSSYVSVLQPDAVPDLVGQSLEEVDAPVRVKCPILGVVNVDVAQLRVVGVGKGSAGTVKRISVQVIVGEEVDRDVHIPARLFIEV